MSEALFSTAQIACTIDHALLHPTMSDAEIRQGCETALRLKVASVCVKPYAVPLAASILEGSPVAVGTVIGFPHGSSPTTIKAAEAFHCLQGGAKELDMVVNIGKAIEGDFDFIREDIFSVLQVAREGRALLKVIFETDYVTSERDKIRLCQICDELEVDFVKTSTGFGFCKVSGGYNYVGATEADIQLMRSHCRAQIGVKASGGIRNRADAEKFLALGCTRLGTSASETILQSEGTDQGGY